MGYSREIDGLRALSVVLVIIFHVRKDWLPGGFVGVDVFFVISGFLITSLIYKEIESEGKFSFAGFYMRRFARLLPALIITLVAVLALGFLFYGPKQFDSLGKDTFFSALGIKNILDAGGANYFVKDVIFKPLLHMWSLGVEEQFYLVWPATLLAICTVFKKYVLPIIGMLILVSIAVSEYGALAGDTASYFMPQYRAFELLAGAGLAVYLVNGKPLPAFGQTVRSALVAVSIAAILAFSFLYNEQMKFPGINGLLIVIPAAVLIVYSQGTMIGRILANKSVVMVGLISYPLYLYHQPIISFTTLWDPEISPIVQLLIVASLGSGLSYLTYRFAETPVRRMVKAGHGKATITFLVLTTLAISGAGLWTAKNQGFPSRLSVLNPYAHSIANGLKPSFHDNFSRGFHKGNLADGPNGPRVLFIGDSQLQQYILPLATYWGYENSQIDIVSRGGCVLLKSADYQDSFADISCDKLREDLFNVSGKYERIVISQAWHSYGGEIGNLTQDGSAPYAPAEWRKLLEPTVEHLSAVSDDIVIIGAHPAAKSTCGRLIAPMTSAEAIKACFATTQIEYGTVKQEDTQFSAAMEGLDARVLKPGDLWCDDADQSCQVGNAQGMPFFRDRHHFGRAANEFLVQRLQEQGL